MGQLVDFIIDYMWLQEADLREIDFHLLMLSILTFVGADGHLRLVTTLVSHGQKLLRAFMRCTDDTLHHLFELIAS